MKPKRLTQRDVSVERTYTGNWLCFALYGGRFRSCMYSGYTKRQAVRDFVQTINQESET